MQRSRLRDVDLMASMQTSLGRMLYHLHTLICVIHSLHTCMLTFLGTNEDERSKEQRRVDQGQIKRRQDPSLASYISKRKAICVFRPQCTDHI